MEHDALLFPNAPNCLALNQEINMPKIVIDNIGTTLECTAEQAANIAWRAAQLDDAARRITPECSTFGPEHAALRECTRAYTASLAEAGDPLAKLL
jgi:hypothetical protein